MHNPPTSPRINRSAPLPLRILTALLPLLAILILITTLYLFHLHHSHLDEDDHHSVSGSALRHKVDLAQFLLDRYNKVDAEKEAERGGWRGGDEEHFIKLVKGLSGENDGSMDEKMPAAESKPTKKGTKIQTTLNLPPNNWNELQQALLSTHLLPTPIDRSQTSRGHSGLPSNQTPALIGAKRGQIYCPDTDPRIQEVMSTYLAFWNDPRGKRDELSIHPNGELWNEAHPHPFLIEPLPLLGEGDMSDPSISKQNRIAWAKMRGKYLTFEPDTGGWNNLRMSFENILIYAAVSGRALVLPPDQNIYLLDPKGGRKGRNYFDLFNLTEHTELLRRVPILTAKEFLEVEGGEHGLVPINGYNATFQKHLWAITEECEDRKKSDVFCEDLYDHYYRHGLLADISAEPPNVDCFVFDTHLFDNNSQDIKTLSPEIQTRIENFCTGRRQVIYNRTMHDAPIWHFETLTNRYRLLVHFYSQNIFTDPILDNYYKRFIRDYLRYHNDAMCAAGKIMLALQYEGYALDPNAGSSMDLDSNLVGGYSSLHIRRGDLQFKEVKIEAREWYENTREIWKPYEVLYIATDEKNRSWFDDFKNSHSGPLRYLSDYAQLIGLGDLDVTVYGLVDTLVASRGSIFAGTWFSTFSGYIVRLRGYHGLSKFSTYYSWLDRKYYMHTWMNSWEASLFSREYPTGWTSIDGDEYVSNDREGRINPYGGRAGELPKPKLEKPVARGVSGLPLSQTKAVGGAHRANITCDHDVSQLAYWNEPQGTRDYLFDTPYQDRSPGLKPKYMAFSMDPGGFNNVRMSMEIVFVLAKVTGRTLILPPDQPMYLLRNDASNRRRGLAGFFDMGGDSFKKRVKFVTMEEFLRKEATPRGQFPLPPNEYDELLKLAMEGCDKREVSCGKIHDYLVKVGVTPNITATHHQCLVIDDGMYQTGVPDNPDSAKVFCSSGNREMVYLTKELNQPQLLYIQAAKPPTRMLAHFYGYIHFTDPSYDNYFRRYVRDLLHYRHEIFCAAGKIVKTLQILGREHGFSTDSEDIGGYSSLHIRRGDFQYKKMKLTPDEWYNNTKDVLQKNEILYISTDEKDKSFFEPFRKAGHTLFFLENFDPHVEGLDPNHMGMVETVVASQGRIFIGTYRSTFSGYINRLRGYYGISMLNSFYGDLEHKLSMHEWNNVNLDTYAKEWPDAWIGIDADKHPSKDKF